MNELIAEVRQAIVDGNADLAAEKVKASLAAGGDPGAVLGRGAVAGIEETGRLWEANEYFLSDVILSAEAFKAVMRELGPRLDAGKDQKRGLILIGTIEGDMHDLGKSIVGAMLSGANFEVLDLGVDVDVATFIEKTREFKPAIVGLGAYMTTTMLLMRDVITGLAKEGLRDKVKVMIGGVPTSDEFAREIGADAWGKDALDAVAKARALVPAQ